MANIREEDRRVTKINERNWKSIKGGKFPDYKITLRTPDGGLFPDYIVKFHLGSGIYGRTVNYPEEMWTPNTIGVAIEEGHEPTTEYRIRQHTPRFFNRNFTTHPSYPEGNQKQEEGRDEV